MFRTRRLARKSFKWWFQQEKHIDFDPDFQRTARVWKEKEKAFLIDSILNLYDIPKFYVVDFSFHNIPEINPGGKRYAIIDGKQRLTALFEFFRDELALNRRFVLDSNPTAQLGGLRFSQLKVADERLARRVENLAPDVWVVETDERAKVNDVFLRLNKAAKALNGAEVRNAMIGKAVDATRRLVQHRFFSHKILFETHRSQEKNACGKVLLLEHKNEPTDTMRATLDYFVREVGVGDGTFNRTIRRVERNLDVLARVFRNGDPLLSAQGKVPIYYMFLTRLPPQQRSGARDFLETFEEQLTKNHHRVGAGRDRDLDSYELASRSTNHLKSYQERLRVLRTKHASWRSGRWPARRPNRPSS